MAKTPARADWERVLADAALLQSRIPSAILVGGTAAAIHAGHRVSFDHGHVLNQLAAHFDEAIPALESIVGWRTKRRIKGKLVLGEIDHMDAGLRNLRRSAPLETTTIKAPNGLNLDVAALSHKLGLPSSVKTLQRMNELCSEFAGEGGDMIMTVIVKLASPNPYDLTDVNLAEYKGIIAPWNDWRAVENQCRFVAVALLGEPPNRDLE